jgi:hypothetical protein
VLRSADLPEVSSNLTRTTWVLIKCAERFSNVRSEMCGGERMSEHQAEVIIQLLEILSHSLAGVRQELVEIKQQLKDEGEVSE